ncbi:MAG: hypothetical protein AAGI24_01485 [Pseudomonadota bacterium]
MNPPHYKPWLLLAVGLVLVILAWTGSLDAISEAYVGDALLDAGIIYGTARGINALVSALQGTELDMWLVTFSIGELLDPVNDVIERFSGVMTIAVASLVIQQLLLVIVSDVTFSVALTALFVATAAAWFLAREGGYLGLLKTFLVVAFIRFSLILVVLANLWVDHAFLPNAESPEHRVMEAFYGDLEEVDRTVRGEGERKRSELSGQFDDLQRKVDEFVSGTLYMLGAVLLKSVLLPVGFFWGLYLLCRRLWAP